MDEQRKYEPHDDLRDDDFIGEDDSFDMMIKMKLKGTKVVNGKLMGIWEFFEVDENGKEMKKLSKDSE